MSSRSKLTLRFLFIPGTVFLIILTAFSVSSRMKNEDMKGRYSFKDFESVKKCRLCHPGFYQQWTHSMMSQAYTHGWDEIEYFDLAVPHADRQPDLKEAVDGCNGCHAPLGFMNGKFPPPRPSENSMANESVSCEVCHLIQSSQTDPPFNFSYLIVPGNTKYSSRKLPAETPGHKIVQNDFFRTTEFCGNCHNELESFWNMGKEHSA